MLALIGIGLDTGDISVSAMDFIKKSGIVLADRFTSIISPDSIVFIEKESGKRVKDATRSDLEENVKATLSHAKDSDMAILIIGDPLVATTHHIILDEAHRQGIKAKVFHSSSIFSAGIGESGLDIYRFGPTATVPFWSDHYKPRSFINVIAKNRANSEHTLLLLDIGQASHTPMSIKQAAEIIRSADSGEVVKGSTKIMVLSDVGRDTQSILYTKFSKLSSLSEKLNGRTISMIIPAKLNFAEEESVKKFGADQAS